MLFSSYIPADQRNMFIKDVNNYAKMLNIKAEWLMAVMWLESKLNPKAYNPKSSAAGLIQFMPNTLIELKTNTSALLKLSLRAQLPFVYMYLKPYANKINSFTDLYFAVFFPAAIGKPDAYILETSKLKASTVASYNPNYDTNKDNRLTKKEVADRIKSLLPLDAQIVLFPGKAVSFALPVIGIAIAAYLFYKTRK